MSESYATLRSRLRELAALNSALNLLGWDQETMMPPAAASTRAEELSLLSRMAHERATSNELGDLLGTCEQDEALRADATIAANLREIRIDYDRARKLPSDFVAEFSETTSHALDQAVVRFSREGDVGSDPNELADSLQDPDDLQDLAG